MKTSIASLVAALIFTAGLPVAGYCQDPLKLGVAGAHSGDFAECGIPAVRAAEMVIKTVNENGGVLGKDATLLVEDDVCRPDRAKEAAVKLVSDGADVLLGHTCSEPTKAALEVYQKADIVVLSPSAATPALTQSGAYPNFFRTAPDDLSKAKRIADFAAGSLGLKKIAIIPEQGGYGKGLSETVKQVLAEKPGVETIESEPVDSSDTTGADLFHQLFRIEAECVIFSGCLGRVTGPAGGIEKKKSDMVFIYAGGMEPKSILQSIGKSVKQVYAVGPAGVLENPLAAKARKMHQKIYEAPPGPFFQNAYAGVLALTNAVEKADSTKAAEIAQILKTERVKTPLGEIRFNDKGEVTGVAVSLFRLKKNGEFEEVNTQTTGSVSAE
jgi:branched-chain amino acid transport system substrate-binding protein